MFDVSKLFVRMLREKFKESPVLTQEPSSGIMKDVGFVALMNDIEIAICENQLWRVGEIRGSEYYIGSFEIESQPIVDEKVSLKVIWKTIIAVLKALFWSDEDEEESFDTITIFYIRESDEKKYLYLYDNTTSTVIEILFPGHIGVYQTKNVEMLHHQSDLIELLLIQHKN